jgi:hypothetical protein
VLRRKRVRSVVEAASSVLGVPSSLYTHSDPLLPRHFLLPRQLGVCRPWASYGVSVGRRGQTDVLEIRVEVQIRDELVYADDSRCQIGADPVKVH